MKLSSIVCASVLAFVGFALAADGAFAAAKVKSHSNTYNNRDVGCPAGQSATTGTTADSNGRKMSGATSYGSSASPCGTPGNGTPDLAKPRSDNSNTGYAVAPSTPATTPPK